MRRGISNVGARVAVAAAIAAMILLPSAAHADEPAPFPYGELAALGALTVEEWLVLDAPVVARLRPGLGWPVVRRLEAGDRVVLRWITPGPDPWLLVRLEGGAAGWLRLGDELALLRKTVEGLPVRRVSPILAAPAGEQVQLYARPAADGASAPAQPWRGCEPASRYCNRSVVGRSPDDRWVALYSQWDTPNVLWASAEQIDLLDADLDVDDLPIFIGEFTALIPTGESDGRAPMYLPPALDMRWTADGSLVGIQEDAYWRYDAARGELELHPRPRGDATLSPDGRYLAVAVCGNGWGDCGLDSYIPFDVLIMPTDGGPSVRTPRASLRPAPAGKFAVSYRVGTWSPDSRFLLAPRAEFSRGEVPDFSLAWSVISVDGGRNELPLTTPAGVRWRRYWYWLDDETLMRWDAPDINPEWMQAVRRDGSQLRTASFPEAYEYAGRIQVSHADRGASARILAWSEEDGWATFEPTTGALARLEALEEIGGEMLRTAPADQSELVAIALKGEARAIAVVETGADVPVLWEWRRGLASTGRQVIARFSDGGYAELPLYAAKPNTYERAAADVSAESLDRHVCGGPWDWSSDGEHFVFLSYEANEQPDGLDGGQRLAGLRIYGRGGALMQSYRTLVEWRRVRQTQWSPDDRWLAVGGRQLGEWECNCCP